MLDIARASFVALFGGFWGLSNLERAAERLHGHVSPINPINPFLAGVVATHAIESAKQNSLSGSITFATPESSSTGKGRKEQSAPSAEAMGPPG